MRRSGALVAIMLLSACGGSQIPSAFHPNSPTIPTAVASASLAPTPSATGGGCPSFAVTRLRTVTASTPLLAVLETRRAGAKESEYSSSHDTLALAGFDGYANVRVTFTPRHVPDISADGGAVPFLQPEAVVAGEAVYVMDGSGVVCRIDRYGASQMITTFPLTSPLEAASFAVSPDGAHLMAAVVTYPTYSPGPKSYQPVVSGSYGLDLELASQGGTAALVRHTDRRWDGPPGFGNIVMGGWDSTGPIGVVGSYEGLGGAPGLDGDRWPGDLAVHAVRLGLDGSIGDSLGPDGSKIPPNGCGLVALGPQGAVLCESGGGLGIKPQVFVGSAAGQILWSSPSSIFAAGGIALSPDGSLMAMDGWVVGKDGSTEALPETFRCRGWLDKQTVIGFVSASAPTIGVVRLSAPGAPENWGFSGEFVGII